MQVVRRLALGVVLMTLASAVLLFSDAGRQRQTGRQPAVRVAVVQHASQPIIEDGVAGMLEALAAAGFVEGQTLTVRRYNAEGDMPTANTIAKEVAEGGYDLILTATTLSLQTVANANRAGKTRHVFALVTDPVVAGVGITGTKPDEHPPWLVGYGTLQPVRRAFELARQFFPGLKRVGVVWNPAEANSEAQLKIARAVAAELGIELVEANAENSAAVLEAAASLVARGIEAIWIPGDVTVLTGVESVVGVGRQAGIPVFTSIPGNTAKGTLFDVGANYLEVGRIAGALGARVLSGTDPRSLGVENVMPERVTLNPAALAGLHDPWRIPAEVAARAAAADAAPSPSAAKASPREPFRLALLEYVNVVDCEDAQRGIRAGLAEAGLVEGRDFILTVRNAQGDMPTLSALVDAALSDRVDMLLTLSTPTLQAALQRAGQVPIVFTFVADAVAAGAGKSNSDHRPNVTGVPTLASYGDMLSIVRQCLPQARRIGTLFAPAETNSEVSKKAVEELAPKYGFELVAVPVNSTAEVSDAALSLLGDGVDAITQVAGNLTSSAFASITTPAKRAGVPVFGFLTSDFDNGATLVTARDYYEGGREAGLLAARILRGESPASIPFVPLSTMKLLVNLDAARAAKVQIPELVLKKAARIVGGEEPHAKAQSRKATMRLSRIHPWRLCPFA